MKKKRFLDNVKTPDAWKQEALARVQAEENRPVLKRWQNIGVIAVTAAVIVSVVAMPAVFDKKASVENDAPAISAAFDENGAVRRIAPAADKDTAAAKLEEMKEQYDYVETVTVIDSSEVFLDGRKITQLVAARQIYKMGNRVFCINIPEDSTDHTEGGQKQMHFGDKIALGFMYTAPENIRSVDVTMNINGREYTANEAIDNTEAKGYALLGGTDDDYFLDVLRSAEAVTGLAEGEYNDECEYITASNYICKMAISPDVSCMTLGDDGRFKTEALLNLFDDRLTGIDISQYIVIKLTDTKEDATPVGKNWYISDTGEVHLGEMTGSLLVESDRPVEILGQKLVPSAEDKNTAYLVINMTDAENTGSLRGKLNITIKMDGTTSKPMGTMTAAGSGDGQSAEYTAGDSYVSGVSFSGSTSDVSCIINPKNSMRVNRYNDRTEVTYGFELSAQTFDEVTAQNVNDNTLRYYFGENADPLYVTVNCDSTIKNGSTAKISDDKLYLEIVIEYEGNIVPPDEHKIFFSNDADDLQPYGGFFEMSAAQSAEDTRLEVTPEKIVQQRQNTDNTDSTWVVYRIGFKPTDGVLPDKVRLLKKSSEDTVIAQFNENAEPVYIKAASDAEFTQVSCCGIYQQDDGFSLDIELKYSDTDSAARHTRFSYSRTGNYSGQNCVEFFEEQQDTDMMKMKVKGVHSGVTDIGDTESLDYIVTPYPDIERRSVTQNGVTKDIVVFRLGIEPKDGSEVSRVGTETVSEDTIKLTVNDDVLYIKADTKGGMISLPADETTDLNEPVSSFIAEIWADYAVMPELKKISEEIRISSDPESMPEDFTVKIMGVSAAKSLGYEIDESSLQFDDTPTVR